MLESNGADEANRTPDLLITNQLLYQLSYISEEQYSSKKIIASANLPVKLSSGDFAMLDCDWNGAT